MKTVEETPGKEKAGGFSSYESCGRKPRKRRGSLPMKLVEERSDKSRPPHSCSHGDGMKRGPENKSLRELIVFLEKASKKNKAPIWLAVARKLSAPRRRRIIVNIGKISKITKDGATVIVPGKLLCSGDLDHKVDIASFSAARGAKEKVSKAGGRLMDIRELVQSNPKGSGIIIVQ
jgi:large subunit ribosomal protein L18e